MDAGGRLDAFFAGRPQARALFDAVARAVAQAAPGAETRVTRSQVAFRRAHPFAAAWTPDRHLRGATAPLVLSVFLPERDGSPRWKEVVQPAPGRWTHHLELRDAAEVDAEVVAWLRRAGDAAA